MPNWCGNTMAVYGSPAELKDFHQKLVNAREKGDQLKHWHLYQIYEEFGYTEQEILESDSNGYIRGYFDDITDIEVTNDGVSYFKLYYESAWAPMIDGFDWLIQRHYQTLAQVTIAEECGCEVYINTDVTGRFFPDKYVLDIEDDDVSYCESEKEVVNIFNDYITNPNKKCKTIKDCYRYLSIHDGYLSPNEENYATLHEFGYQMQRRIRRVKARLFFTPHLVKHGP